MTRSTFAFVLLAGLFPCASALPAQWSPMGTGTTAEFRGLSAVNGETVWASGRGGVVAHTTDGGHSWQVDTIVGAENLFLVDIHGLSATSAIVLGTSFDGGLSRILRTDDAGVSWTEQYRNDHPQVFLDGLAFWDSRRGLAFGDPVDGAFMVLRTEDGGTTWQPVPNTALPPPLAGEAAFAASGTAITARGEGLAWFVTGGGATARVYRTTDWGRNWTVAGTPIPAGSAAGLFGVAFGDDLNGVVVGGDYQQPTVAVPSAARTDDGGLSWTPIDQPEPGGVKYGIATAGSGRYVAVGPPGAGRSGDGGARWAAVPGAGFNTVAFADGVVWAAGTEGRIARIRP